MGFADPTSLVTVKMKGLGVAHLNGDLWEFLFLRNPENDNSCHKMKVIIREYRDDLDEPITKVYPIPVSMQKMSVKTLETHANTLQYKPSETFYWDVARDSPYDVRWLPDLSELYYIGSPAPVKLMRKTPNRQLTYLSINHGKFYTHELSEEKYSFTRRGQEIAVRKVGLWLGLDVSWSLSGSYTEVDLGVGFETLRRKPHVKSYEIEFNNDCLRETDGTDLDFKHYYKQLIAEPDEVKQELNKIMTKKVMSGRIDCHLVNASQIQNESGGTMHSLADLL